MILNYYFIILFDKSVLRKDLYFPAKIYNEWKWDGIWEVVEKWEVFYDVKISVFILIVEF